jgi:hypothetical protein
MLLATAAVNGISTLVFTLLYIFPNSCLECYVKSDPTLEFHFMMPPFLFPTIKLC